MKRWFLGEEAGPRYQEARLAVIERILDLAVARSCDAVVVAGDVFDDNLVDSRTWRRAVDILRASPVPVFLLPGNHDPYDPASIYRDPVFEGLSPTVRVLTDTTAQRARDAADGRPALEIVGAPLLSKYVSADPVAGHGATSSRSSAGDPAVIDVDVAAQACRDRLVDYVALGDTHSAVNLHEDGTVRYSGSPEPTDFREEDGGGEGRSGFALVVDITLDPEAPVAPATVTVDEVPVGTWHFLALSARIDSDEGVTDWIRRLGELPDKRTTVVKYALTGTVDLATGARLDRETAEKVPSFAALYPRERLMDLHTAPDDGELAEARWPGAVGEASRVLASRTAEGDATARDALRLLYRLSAEPAGTTTGKGN